MKGLDTVPRCEIVRGEAGYPAALLRAERPPERIYIMGDPSALEEGIAVIGARKATPYGLGCARRFARRAAQRGIAVVSGGARGCDAAAHEGALEGGGRTIAVLGGGADHVYPAENFSLFVRIVECGGALMSEQPWATVPRPWMFRQRNRLIAALARATLIVEAGLPSGTFSTADDALAASRDVLVVPGAITAETSRGANRLLYQGAAPIVDDDSFDDALFSLFGCLKQEVALARKPTDQKVRADDALIAAVRAGPLGTDALMEVSRRCCRGGDARSWLAARLAEAEAAGVIARYPDGRWGPAGESRAGW